MSNMEETFSGNVVLYRCFKSFHLQEDFFFPKTQAGDHAYRRNGAGKLLQESRKLNCPAQVHMREIIKFPEYKVSRNKEIAKCN